MKKLFSPPILLALAWLIAGCSVFNPRPPANPTQLPPPPPVIQTDVAQTLTAVAPTRQGGTAIPPPTQISGVTPTPNETQAPAFPTPNVPPPTPGGEINPPTVQLLAPAQGVQLTANQSINVVTLVSDDQGIRLVEFYADNVLQNTLTPAQPTTYQAVFPWSSVQVGQHTLFVIAYDVFNNASAPATVSVTVNANTTAPQVSILSPSSPQSIALGAQIQVQVVASDEAGVTRLQMLVDDRPYSQVVSQTPGGQTPFAATFIYAANTPGTHTILLRAFDVAGNIGSSNPLTLNVNDNTPPSVSTNYSQYDVRVNEQVIVYTNANDASGIQRVELWADGNLYNVYNSPNPRAQTSISLQQIWASNVAGDHTLFVRVFDVNNQSAAAPAATIRVRTPQQPTWTPPPFIPTRTPYPTRTPPPVIPPPNCAMDSPGTNFRVELPDFVRIRWTCSAQGGVGQMEVYYQYSGVMATLIDQVPGDGRDRQSGDFDWTPPAPGMVDVFVVAFDRMAQRGESPHIPGLVQAPRPPTIPPPPTREPEQGINGRWRGEIDNGAFIIDLEPRIGCSQTQCAYGGTFQDTRENVSGEINGQFDGTSLRLGVENAQPGDVTWNFEGQVTAGGREIIGQWSEARAGVPSLQRGSVAFRR